MYIVLNTYYARRPALTRLNSRHYSSTGLVHGFINVALILCELAIGWEWTSDVGCVAVVFSAHVKQAKAEGNPFYHWQTAGSLTVYVITCSAVKEIQEYSPHVAIIDLLVIWSSSMAIMKSSTVVATEIQHEQKQKKLQWNHSRWHDLGFEHSDVIQSTCV